MDEATQPIIEARTPEHDVSPPPVGMLVVMWIGVFSVIAYGMALLFNTGRHRADRPERSEADQVD